MDYLKINNIPITGVEKVFGNEQTIFGNSQRDLILRTRGKVKVQWGNKFVDLFSMGKLLGLDLNIFRQVQTSSEIDLSINGIVYVAENSSLYIVYDSKIFEISTSEGEYVSFKIAQLTNGLEKDTAMKNIGLLFDTLNDFESAVSENNIGQGLAFVIETSEIYSVVNGDVQSLFLNKQSGGTVYNTIYIDTNTAIDTKGKLKLGNTLIGENAIEIVNTFNINLNGVDIIQVSPSETVFSGINRFSDKLIVNTIESPNYTKEQSGFSIYQLDNKSYLDIDYVIMRYPILSTSANNGNVFSNIWIDNYGTINYQNIESGNIIISIVEENSNSIPKYSINDDLSIFIINNTTTIEGIELKFKVINIEIYYGDNPLDDRNAGIYYTLENLGQLEIGNLLYEKIFRIGAAQLNSRSVLNIYDSYPISTSYSSPNIDLYENIEHREEINIQNINTKIGNLKLSPIKDEVSLNSESLNYPKFKHFGLYSNNAHLRGGKLKGLDTEIDLTYGGLKSSNVNISGGIIKSKDETSIILDLNNNSMTFPKVNEEIDINIVNKDLLSQTEMIELTTKLDLTKQLPIIILVNGVHYGFGTIICYLTNNTLEVSISIFPYDPDLFNRQGYQYRVDDYNTNYSTYTFIKQKTY